MLMNWTERLLQMYEVVKRTPCLYTVVLVSESCGNIMESYNLTDVVETSPSFHFVCLETQQ